MSTKLIESILAVGRKFHFQHARALVALTTALAGAAVGQPLTPPSVAKPKYLYVRDSAGIGQAMQAGDARNLKALSEAALAEPIKTLALASYYRSIYQIGLSSKYAKKCYVEGLEALPGNAVAAIRCGELLAGNYAISGQIANWARTMQAMRDKVYPVATSSMHETNLIFPHFGSIGNRLEMTDFFDFPIETITGNVGSDIVIPRVLASGKKPRRDAFDTGICEFNIRCFGSVYYIKVNVDGHNTVGVLDTGSVVTLVTPSEASKLGVHVNQGSYYRVTSTENAHAVTHLGYARSIRIRASAGNNIVLRNVAVQVGGELPRNVPIVLGLNVLSKFGSFLLQKKKVFLNPDTSSSTCDDPMHIRSTINGGYLIFFRYPVGGQLQNVVLDTGQNQYLFGTSRATAKRSSSQTLVAHSVRATGDVEAMYYPAQITFGDLAYENYLTIPVFLNYKQPYPYAIGVDILQDYDIFLDFDHGMACLIRK